MPGLLGSIREKVMSVVGAGQSGTAHEARDSAGMVDNLIASAYTPPLEAGAFSRINILIFWKKAHRAVSSFNKYVLRKTAGDDILGNEALPGYPASRPTRR